ncbi:MAG: hypothetical protein JWN56_378 [Sphingobacteriales bacterium]|nr:hypothetical protein [Sphingobacteriales bacterium]
MREVKVGVISLLGILFEIQYSKKVKWDLY